MSKTNNVDTQKKIKVLAYCDAPVCATGFATVSRNILGGLYSTGRYEFDILGINYWGTPHNFPGRIWPTGVNGERDPYGRKMCFNMIQKMEYDLLFFLQDTFILEFLPELHSVLKLNGKKFKSICYYPIDGVPKKQWISNIDVCDYVVAYSEYGKKQSMTALPSMKEPLVIPHGANTKDYFPINKDEVASFRKQFFGPQADKFIFTNVNRNQQRKDIPRTIAAFKEFKKRVPDSILYLHMSKKDQGWDLVEVVKAYGLNITTDVVFPENFGPNQGYPRDIVNMIYNASDCVLSTTLGEGMGLGWIEAMSAKTPVIVPDNTAMSEFVTEDRGWKVKSGSNPSLFTVVPNDNEIIRPLVDVEDLVTKMLEIYNNKEEANRRAEVAYNWVHTKMDWSNCIVPQWVEVFDAASRDLVTTQDKPSESTSENIDVINTETF